MHGEWIVPLVFVLPCERIFALLLLPEDLEHGAIEEQIEAVTHGLDANALTMDIHLVNEAFLLPIFWNRIELVIKFWLHHTVFLLK